MCRRPWISQQQVIAFLLVVLQHAVDTEGKPISGSEGALLSRLEGELNVACLLGCGRTMKFAKVRSSRLPSALAPPAAEQMLLAFLP